MTIRQLIREMLWEVIEKDIDEAHAGSLGFAYEKPEYQVPDSDETEPEGEEEFQAYVKDRARGAQRYARSGRFKHLAEKHYANIPFPVWTAPYIGNLSGFSTVIDQPERCGRMGMMDLVYDGKSVLRKLGYTTEGVSGGDLVILYTTGVANAAVLATPWMIIHAIFDSGKCIDFIHGGYSDIERVLLTGEGDAVAKHFLGSIAKNDDFAWNSYLTMKSARDYKITAANDAFAEMICQELLTRGGLRLDLEGLEQAEREALVWLGQEAKQVAHSFRRAARGKLIIIAVNQGDV